MKRRIFAFYKGGISVHREECFLHAEGGRRVNNFSSASFDRGRIEREALMIGGATITACWILIFDCDKYGADGLNTYIV